MLLFRLFDLKSCEWNVGRMRNNVSLYIVYGRSKKFLKLDVKILV